MRAGVVVANIDNGFGAGVFAARVARRVGRPAADGPAAHRPAADERVAHGPAADVAADGPAGP